MIDPTLREQIDRYLMGQSSAEEAERLKTAAMNDSALAEQIEIQRLAIAGYRKLAAAELRKKMNRWDQELEKAPENNSIPAVKPRLTVWVWIAILMLLTGMLSLILWQHKQINRREEDILARDSAYALLHSGFLALESQKNPVAADSISQKETVPPKPPQKKRPASSTSYTPLELKLLGDIALMVAPPAARLADQNRENILDDPNRIVYEPRSRSFPKDSSGNGLSAERMQFINGSIHDEALLADPEILFGAGVQQFTNGNYEAAAGVFRATLSRDSSHTPARMFLAYALFYGRRFSEARQAFAELDRRVWNQKKEVQFYTMLCLIGEGALEKANKIRNDILFLPGLHRYYEKTRSLEPLFPAGERRRLPVMQLSSPYQKY